MNAKVMAGAGAIAVLGGLVGALVTNARGTPHAEAVVTHEAAPAFVVRQPLFTFTGQHAVAFREAQECGAAFADLVADDGTRLVVACVKDAGWVHVMKVEAPPGKTAAMVGRLKFGPLADGSGWGAEAR